MTLKSGEFAGSPNLGTWTAIWTAKERPPEHVLGSQAMKGFQSFTGQIILNRAVSDFGRPASSPPLL